MLLQLEYSSKDVLVASLAGVVIGILKLIDFETVSNALVMGSQKQTSQDCLKQAVVVSRDLSFCVRT